MHNFVYLAQRRSQEFSCEPNFRGGGHAPAPLAAPLIGSWIGLWSLLGRMSPLTCNTKRKALYACVWWIAEEGAEEGSTDSWLVTKGWRRRPLWSQMQATALSDASNVASSISLISTVHYETITLCNWQKFKNIEYHWCVFPSRLRGPRALGPYSVITQAASTCTFHLEWPWKWITTASLLLQQMTSVQHSERRVVLLQTAQHTVHCTYISAK